MALSVRALDFGVFVNFTGLIAVAVSLLSCIVVFSLVREWSLRGRLVGWVLSGLLALPGATFTFYYLHWLPETAGYFEFRSWKWTEFLVVPIGIAGGFIASFTPKGWRAGVLAAAFAGSLVPFCKPLIAPLNPAHFQNLVHDGIWRQSTMSTCGPASTATILNGFDRNLTEQEIAERAHSYWGGTEIWYLVRLIRDEGLKATFHTGDGFDPNPPFPVIAGVELAGLGHFIPMLGREGESYVIADPIRGREVVSEAELKYRYDFTGFYLEISE